MDFLNPLISQVRELFASMTPGARVTAGLLLAVVVVSLGFLFQQATVGPDQYLFGGDPIGRERLPRMEAAMAAAGIDFEVVGNRIKVSNANKNAALAAIADAGELPPEFHNLMDDALNGGGMFEFREQKMERIRAAYGARAELILNDFPWVSKARVIHHVRSEPSLKNRRHATAAVSITPVPGESITTARVRTVKDFISKACDVPLEHVTVMNTGGDLLAGGDGISPDDLGHELYRIKAMQEEITKTKILKQLSYIPGIRVQVKATLSNVAEETERVLSTVGEPITISSVANKTKDEQTTAVPGERVGVVASGPENVPRETGALAKQDKSKKETSQKETEQVVGKSQKTTVTAGYATKEMDASVAVPLAYVEDVYRQKNLDEDGNEPEEIDPTAFNALKSDIQTRVEDIVQPLLPRLSLGEDKFRQVNVTFIDTFPEEPIAGPSLASGALGWLGSHTSTLAMAGLAVFGLVMLRSIVSGAKEGPVSGLPALQLDGEPLTEGSGDDDEDEARPKLKLRKPETLKDDLSEMVSNDPDAAAAILKSWINNAA